MAGSGTRNQVGRGRDRMRSTERPHTASPSLAGRSTFANCVWRFAMRKTPTRQSVRTKGMTALHVLESGQVSGCRRLTSHSDHFTGERRYSMRRRRASHTLSAWRGRLAWYGRQDRHGREATGDEQVAGPPAARGRAGLPTTSRNRMPESLSTLRPRRRELRLCPPPRRWTVPRSLHQ